MKRLTISLVFVLAIVCMVALPAPAQSTKRGGIRDQICVYENNYFGGWQQCFAPGEQISDLGDHRNKISSIRVFGDARLLAFADRNFEGVSLEITADMNDLAQQKSSGPFIAGTWNDKIESIRVTGRLDVRDRRDDPRDRDYRIDDRPVFPNSRNVVCVYENLDYRGRYECFQAGEEVADLGRRINWNDRISSVRVFGSARVTIYRDINFRGDRVTIDRDISDLRRVRMTGSMNWDNQISSLDINGGRGRAYGHDSSRRFR
jgi:Peptidase inhibitor family I36